MNIRAICRSEILVNVNWDRKSLQSSRRQYENHVKERFPPSASPPYLIYTWAGSSFELDSEVVLSHVSVVSY